MSSSMFCTDNSGLQCCPTQYGYNNGTITITYSCGPPKTISVYEFIFILYEILYSKGDGKYLPSTLQHIATNRHAKRAINQSCDYNPWCIMYSNRLVSLNYSITPTLLEYNKTLTIDSTTNALTYYNYPYPIPYAGYDSIRVMLYGAGGNAQDPESGGSHYGAGSGAFSMIEVPFLKTINGNILLLINIQFVVCNAGNSSAYTQAIFTYSDKSSIIIASGTGQGPTDSTPGSGGPTSYKNTTSLTISTPTLIDGADGSDNGETNGYTVSGSSNTTSLTISTPPLAGVRGSENTENNPPNENYSSPVSQTFTVATGMNSTTTVSITSSGGGGGTTPTPGNNETLYFGGGGAATPSSVSSALSPYTISNVRNGSDGVILYTLVKANTN